MGAIQWREDLEEMEEEENSQDMKIEKRRRGRRYRWGKSELFMWFIIIIVCNIFIFSEDGCHTRDRRFRIDEEEGSEDMKIKKRRRGRRYRWGKGEIFMWFIMIIFCNVLSFQLMGAIQWREDLEEMKIHKTQKTWRLRREEEEEDIDEVKANYLCDSL